MITQIKGKHGDTLNPASNATVIAKDIQSIALEIDSILANTKFNDTALLTSSGGGGGFTFQTGATSDETLVVDFNSALGGDTDVTGGTALDVGTTVSESLDLLLTVADGGDDAANAALIADLTTTLEAFESTVDDSLGSIGNFVQRLDAKDDSLTSAIANSQASVSRLFDADMAMEQLNATKSSIGGQAATSMLAQLNFAPQAVLQLLG
jgi:flagellin